MKSNYKRGPDKDHRYILYDPEGEGLMFFRNKEDRDQKAEEVIKFYCSDDGWDEEVKDIFAGEITALATKVDVEARPENLSEDGCDAGGIYWEADCYERCNYSLVEVEKC